MAIFLAELLGTALLIILGDGVVANVLLSKSKGEDSGWIVIATGWGFAVAIAVYVTGWVSGAHINPAVTIALLVSGDLAANQFLPYIGGQMLGAFFGGIVVWAHYLPHWRETDDADKKLGVFCTAPAIRATIPNLLSEIIGTMVLIVGVMGIGHKMGTIGDFGSGLSPLLIGVLVWSIGLSLGGPTGYAINPARDLGPRLAHALLPIPGKRDADWSYAWIPVIGPIIGGALGALLFRGYLSLVAGGAS